MTSAIPKPSEEGVVSPTTGRRRRRRRIVSWMIVLVPLTVVGLAVLSQVGLWRTRVAIESRHQESAGVWLTVSGACWPRSAEWHYLSSITERRAQNFLNVEHHLRRAHELGWPTNDLERQQKLAEAQTGQFAKIGSRWGELFQTAGSDGPELCRAYIDFALSRLRLDLVPDVLNGWRKDFPTDPGPFVIEGTIASVLFRWEEAERLFRKALELDPTLEKARIKLAESLAKQLKFTSAEKELRMLPGSSEKPEVVALLAQCIAQQGRHEESMDLLRVGIEKSPDEPVLLAEAGRLELMLGKNEEAIEYLAKVLERQPENTEIRYAYAQALQNTGDRDGAKQHFRLVDEGTKALRELSALTNAVTNNPADVEKRFELGTVMWRWKSRKDGAAWLNSVLEFDPTHQQTHQLLAKHYAMMGDDEKAQRHEESARATDGQPE